jgi:hypothetical protein
MTRISTYGGIELSGFGQLTFLKFLDNIVGQTFHASDCECPSCIPIGKKSINHFL